MHSTSDNALIGVISDTHGLLRQEAVRLLAPCGLIVHAGDVDDASVLEELEKIAPVVAVRGNVDTGAWAASLKETELFERAGKHIFVLHNLGRLGLVPAAAKIDVVIYGHSHRPSVENRNGILYLNPGSAGPRRFGLPVSMARLVVRDGVLSPELLIIEPAR